MPSLALVLVSAFSGGVDSTAWLRRYWMNTQYLQQHHDHPFAKSQSPELPPHLPPQAVTALAGMGLEHLELVVDHKPTSR